jgi:hypothetical protein
MPGCKRTRVGPFPCRRYRILRPCTVKKASCGALVGGAVATTLLEETGADPPAAGAEATAALVGVDGTCGQGAGGEAHATIQVDSPNAHEILVLSLIVGTSAEVHGSCNNLPLGHRIERRRAHPGRRRAHAVERPPLDL